MTFICSHDVSRCTGWQKGCLVQHYRYMLRPVVCMLMAIVWMASWSSQAYSVQNVQWLSAGDDFYVSGNNWFGGAPPTATQSALFVESATNDTVFWNDGSGNTTTANVTVQNDRFLFAGAAASRTDGTQYPFSHTATGTTTCVSPRVADSRFGDLGG